MENLSWTPEQIVEPLGEAVRLIQAARHVLVVGHANPDGDAIGSTLAVRALLVQLGVDVTCFNVHGVPRGLRFLPGAEGVVDSYTGPQPDLTILLDCCEKSRVGEDFPEHGWGKKIICLDHHKTVDREFADVLIHDVEAAATAELVYRLACACGVELSRDLATCIFSALHTDTGSFRYGCTTWKTMEVASNVLRSGIDTWEVASSLYEGESLARTKLIAEAIQSIELSSCGRLATMSITDLMLERAGAHADDADGLINYARRIEGVEVAAQLTQQASGPLRVSFRSRGNIDVSMLAERFGGGGHFNAAGCRIDSSIDEARALLSEALAAVLVQS